MNILYLCSISSRQLWGGILLFILLVLIICAASNLDEWYVKIKTFKDPKRFTSLKKVAYLGVYQILPDKILVGELVHGKGKVFYDTKTGEYCRFQSLLPEGCRLLPELYRIGNRFWLLKPSYLKRFEPGDVLRILNGALVVCDQTTEVVWEKKIPKK